MSTYLISRIFRAAFTILGILTLVFFMIRIVPGDPVDAILGDQATAAERHALRHALLLDRPLGTQYRVFVGNALQLDLGRSFRYRDQSVMQRISEVIGNTYILACAAFVFAWLCGLSLGTLAGARRGTRYDKVASGVGLLGLAIPSIWLGPLLIWLFAVKLRWVPMPGDEGLSTWILPVITLGSGLSGIMTRQTRGGVAEALSQPFTTAARARGASAFRTVVVHALRNALLPLVTLGGAQLAALLSGSIITEKIFELNGLGTLFLSAFQTRDIPIIQGCVLVIATTYVAINLVVDLLYPLIDPRVRLS